VLLLDSGEVGIGRPGPDPSSGSAGAGVASDVGDFEDARVFVSRLNHLLRPAVLRTALVVSSVIHIPSFVRRLRRVMRVG